MKTENIDKIRALREAARNLRRVRATYKNATSDASCDKHGLGFNRDDRFQIFGCKSVHLDGWIGYFGNSGCTTLLSVSSEHAHGLLVAALNKNMDLILEDMAHFADLKAAELKAEAEKELARLRELLDASEVAHV